MANQSDYRDGVTTIWNRDEVWWNERGGIAIATRSDTSTTKFVGPTGDLTVTVFVIKNANTLVDSDVGLSGQTGYSDSPDIPEEWHEAIVNFAISKGYEMLPQGQGISQAGYFRSRYDETVREAKKDANRNQDGSNFTVVGSEF